MKYITLVASEIVDGNKVELGRCDKFPVAEKVEDILDMVNQDNGWNDDEIVACFNSGSKVKRQAQLRSVTDPKAPSSIFKKLSKERQDEILRKEGLL